MNENTTIPTRILNAALNKSEYFALHRDYTRIYDLSDKAAWEKLESDLSYHGLPNRYSAVEYFYSKRHDLVRVNSGSGTPK